MVRVERARQELGKGWSRARLRSSLKYTPALVTLPRVMLTPAFSKRLILRKLQNSGFGYLIDSRLAAGVRLILLGLEILVLQVIDCNRFARRYKI